MVILTHWIVSSGWTKVTLKLGAQHFIMFRPTSSLSLSDLILKKLHTKRNSALLPTENIFKLYLNSIKEEDLPTSRNYSGDLTHIWNYVETIYKPLNIAQKKKVVLEILSGWQRLNQEMKLYEITSSEETYRQFAANTTDSTYDIDARYWRTWWQDILQKSAHTQEEYGFQAYQAAGKRKLLQNYVTNSTGKDKTNGGTDIPESLLF